MSTYKAGQYKDPDTGRTRWAMLDTLSRCWYIPDRYGKRAAERLAARANNAAKAICERD